MLDVTAAETRHWPASTVRATAGLSLLGILLSALAFTAMHVGFGDGFDAVSQTLSELVYVEGGASLIPISMVTLGFGSLVLLPVLRGSGALDGRLLPVLVGLWGTGLVLCAYFPADLPNAALTFSGWTHRISACVAFLSLAVAGLIMSRRFRDHAIWRPTAGITLVLALLTSVQFGIFLLASMPVVTPDLWGAELFADFLVRGFVERTMLGTQVVMLVLWIGRLLYLTSPRRPAVHAGSDARVDDGSPAPEHEVTEPEDERITLDRSTVKEVLVGPAGEILNRGAEDARAARRMHTG